MLPTPNATLLPSGTLGFDEAIPAGSRPVRAQGFAGLFIRKAIGQLFSCRADGRLASIQSFIGSHSQRLLRRLADYARTGLAPAAARGEMFADRVLVPGVFGSGNSGRVSAGRRLGSRQQSVPLAAGAAHGSEFQEAVIRWVAYSAAPTVITSFALIFWGLRKEPGGTNSARQ